MEAGFVDRTVDAVGGTLRDTFLDSGAGWRTWAGLLLLLPATAGVLALGASRGPAAPMVLVGPVLAALAASALHRYPFAPRLMLFSVPLVAILVAAGVETLIRRVLPRKPPVALPLLSAVLLLLPLRTDLSLAIRPEPPEDLRSLARVFQREHAPGDAIYVFGRSMPGWLFYSTDWEHPDRARVRELSELVGSTGVAFRNAPSRGHPVKEEGDSLRYARGDYLELVGIPAGTGPAPGLPNGQDRPDTGWARNELRRLRVAAGTASGWCLVTSFKPAVLDSLLATSSAEGAMLQSRWDSPRGVLLRYRFRGQ
jgi:hypothetical protein